MMAEGRDQRLRDIRNRLVLSTSDDSYENAYEPVGEYAYADIEWLLSDNGRLERELREAKRGLAALSKSQKVGT